MPYKKFFFNINPNNAIEIMHILVVITNKISPINSSFQALLTISVINFIMSYSLKNKPACGKTEAI
jgi:hypothetical protein